MVTTAETFGPGRVPHSGSLSTIPNVFNGGVRTFDLADPFRPVEGAHAVPPPPRKSSAKSIQLNDVFVDDRGVLFTVDRMIVGLCAYELKV